MRIVCAVAAFGVVVLSSCSSATGVGSIPAGSSRIAPAHDRKGYALLYSFQGRYDGSSPQAGLMAVDGALYGTTVYGVNRWGNVFSIVPSGKERTLYPFSGPPDGQNPLAGLLKVNGTLYGTTVHGGSSGQGSVFALTSANSEQTVYSFSFYDGIWPYAGLVSYRGKLYGTASSGGVAHSASGVVFSLSLSGTEKVLHTFAGAPDGDTPLSPLIEVKHRFYGTTKSGGAYGDGALFEVSPSGAERLLYQFRGYDGGEPLQGALIYDNGALYGTTSAGGKYAQGVVFKVTLSGDETVLYNFKGGSDGAQPNSGLVEYRGAFYGTTTEGGSSGSGGYGTIFRLSRSREERVLHRFHGAPDDGREPESALTLLGGKLYGTTLSGGSKGYGTVFTYSP